MYFAKNGKTGSSTEGTLGAYGLKGSASGSFNIGPMTFSATQGGSFGSAHIGGNAGAYYNHVKRTVVAEVGWNIGLGVGEETKFKFEYKVP